MYVVHQDQHSLGEKYIRLSVSTPSSSFNADKSVVGPRVCFYHGACYLSRPVLGLQLSLSSPPSLVRVLRHLPRSFGHYITRLIQESLHAAPMRSPVFFALCCQVFKERMGATFNPIEEKNQSYITVKSG